LVKLIIERSGAMVAAAVVKALSVLLSELLVKDCSRRFPMNPYPPYTDPPPPDPQYAKKSREEIRGG
jgi:hypothetical protein